MSFNLYLISILSSLSYIVILHHEIYHFSGGFRFVISLILLESCYSRSQKQMKEKVDSPVTVLEDYFKSSDSESSSSKEPTVDSESQDISKPSSKWNSFLQFLSTKSKKQIHTLDPLNGQLTRRMSRSRSMRESILPSCLTLTNATSTPCRSPWKIFTHHDIQAATNSFSQGNSFRPCLDRRLN